MKTGTSCAPGTPARFLYDDEGVQVWEIEAHEGLDAILILGSDEQIVLLARRLVGTAGEQDALGWAGAHRGIGSPNGAYVRLC